MRTNKKNKYLAYGAMLSALGTVLLLVGSFIDTMTLSFAALASMLCVYAVIEMGGNYPFAVWGVTSFLAFLIVPQKDTAFFYLLIGSYPIWKEKIEKSLSRTVRVIWKSVCFFVAAGGFCAITFLFFPTQMQGYSLWFYPLLFALGAVTFFLYDYALTKIISFYLIRLHERFQIK